MTFLSTVAFRATKLPTTLRADVPVAFGATKNLEDIMLPVNYRSWQRSFSALRNSCQQWELTFLKTASFRDNKILSTVRVHIPGDCSFQRYQNPDNFKSWRSCSFQSYVKIWKTLCFPSTIGVENVVYRNPVTSGSWHSIRP